MNFVIEFRHENETSLSWHFLISDGNDYCLAGTGPQEISKMDYRTPVNPNSLPIIWDQLIQSGKIHHIGTSIIERLESMDGVSGDQRVVFWEIFADSTWMSNGPPKKIEPRGYDRKGNLNNCMRSDELIAAYRVFYRSLFLFLFTDQRYVRLDAHLATLFFCWQWYQLSKVLSYWVMRENSNDLRKIRNLLTREMAAAHHYLVSLLDDQDFAFAVRWLCLFLKLPNLPGPILREQLRLCLPLVSDYQITEGEIPPDGFEGKPLEKGYELGSPWPSPGCKSDRKYYPAVDWQKVRLHPVFQSYDNSTQPAEKQPKGRKTESNGRAAMRMLMSQWLIARYDLINVLGLAALLKNNRLGRGRTLPAIWMFLILVISNIIGVVSGSLLVRYFGGLTAPVWVKFAVSFWEIVCCIGFPALIFRGNYDTGVLPYLLMPRLTGGIIVGYLAFILQEDALYLQNYFYRPALPWFAYFSISLLFIITLGLGYLYLYYDVLPLVRLNSVARIRAGLMLGVSLFFSAFIGLGAVALTNAMYGMGDYNFWGPFGWVNFQLYLLLVLVALFTGLVTQFIFEEKTITSSVWSPDQD